MKRITPAQLAPLLLLLVCMFGCKAGQVLRIVGAVAITTVRVAAIAAAASSHHHHVEAGTPTGPAQTAEEQARTDAAENENAPGACTELFVETIPPTPEGTAPPRAAECQGHVLVQDVEGHWRAYDKSTTVVVTEP